MHSMNNVSSIKKQGFTLLYSLIISSLILATVLSIVNVALKQNNITGLSERSQVAFYAANSGMECALYWVLHGRSVVSDSVESIPLFKIPRGDNESFSGQYDSPLLSNDDDTITIRTDDDDVLPPIKCFGNNIVKDPDVYGFNTQYSFYSRGNWFDAIRGDKLYTDGVGASLEQLCGKGFVNSESTSIPEEDYRVWLFRVIMPEGLGASIDDPCAEVAVCRRLDKAHLSISSRGYNTCDISSKDVVERAVRLIQL